MIKKKKKINQNISKVRMYIQASFNNTIVSITDEYGNLLASASAGSVGFKGARKSTLYAAQVTTQKVLDKVKIYPIKNIDVVVSGVGPGRDSAVRSLIGSGYILGTIKDKTPLPHNGCRPKKIRRV